MAHFLKRLWSLRNPVWMPWSFALGEVTPAAVTGDRSAGSGPFRVWSIPRLPRSAGRTIQHHVGRWRGMRATSLRMPLLGGLYISVHLLLDWLSFVHPFGAFGITPWNPSTGLGFVLVLRYG